MGLSLLTIAVIIASNNTLHLRRLKPHPAGSCYKRRRPGAFSDERARVGARTGRGSDCVPLRELLLTSTPASAFSTSLTAGSDAGRIAITITMTIKAILVVAADHVFIAWATVDTDNCLVGVYDTTTGAERATAAARCGALPRAGATYASNATVAGVGPFVLDGESLTVVDGATVTAIVDQVYGTAGGSVVISPGGIATLLPEGTLIPVRQSDQHLLVVDSDQVM